MRLRKVGLMLDILTILSVLTVVTLLIYSWLTYETEEETAQARVALRGGIDRALRQVLPTTDASSATIYESRRCKGAAVIQKVEENWVLAFAWYDKQTKQFTDIIKREELVSRLSQYVDVDPEGLAGWWRVGQRTELYAGSFRSSGSNAWIRLDPNSCGVRSGWLIYNEGLSDKETRRKIKW